MQFYSKMVKYCMKEWIIKSLDWNQIQYSYISNGEFCLLWGWVEVFSTYSLIFCIVRVDDPCEAVEDRQLKSIMELMETFPPKPSSSTVNIRIVIVLSFDIIVGLKTLLIEQSLGLLDRFIDWSNRKDGVEISLRLMFSVFISLSSFSCGWQEN